VSPLLEIEDLRVAFHTDDGIVGAVDGVSLSVDRKRTLGVVGESGSGKSVTGLTVMGLTRGHTTTISGSVRFDGRELTAASDAELRSVRGSDIAMIFQDPLSSLHPFYTVGRQLVEAVRAHRDVGKAEAHDRSVELMRLVGIPEPEQRMRAYPHEFSGGMRQRAMIAMALVNDPKLLIADEPTTALDVTVQAQILDLLNGLVRELNAAVVIVTHDLGVIARMCDRVIVLYGGRIMEEAAIDDLFEAPRHPYSRGLLAATPRLDDDTAHDLRTIPGTPRALAGQISGCPFAPRCDRRIERCTVETPPLQRGAGGRAAACHLVTP
jgi:peptide/nickel transport system ATP-binding protein